MQAGSEIGKLIVDHNTVAQGGTFLTLYYGDVWVAGTNARRPAKFAVDSLTVTNTLGHHNEYGVYGESSGLATSALKGLTRTYVWTHNVLAGEQGRGQTYPSVTWQPTMAEHLAQFGENHVLTAGSKYRKAGNDGQDLGVVPAGSGSVVGPPVSPPLLLTPPRNLRISVRTS
jgi:hypothetical protein